MTCCLLLPVFQDAVSARAVIARTATLLEPLDEVRVLVIDDGSPVPIGLDDLLIAPVPASIVSVRLVRLRTNVGHQRAIAVGLVDSLLSGDDGFLIIMDSDGEDRPEDVPALLEAAWHHSDVAVVGRRASRSEGRIFRISYRVYRTLFRGLTGVELPFGNFSVVPHSAQRRLAAMPELWNHYAAALKKSGQPIVEVGVDRGLRLAGQSRMRFSGLVNHGLSAISVFSDRVFARLLALLLAFLLALAQAAATLIAARIATDFAIPGWTTTVVGLLALGIVQVGSVLALLTFVILGNRSAPTVDPVKKAPSLVDCVEEWVR